MKILITGANGRLGRAVVSAAEARGHSLVSTTRDSLSLSNPNVMRAELANLGAFDVMVNCAAMTDVDACESTPETATAINGTAVGVLAAHCNTIGARFMHISTDYVFPGKASGSYAEDDAPHPVCNYGATKLLGESLALQNHPDGTQIFRTAWLYGQTGHGFIDTIVQRLKSGEQPRIIADQIGQPTRAADLADHLLNASERQLVPGIFHATNSGEASWLTLVERIVDAIGADRQQLRAVAAADLQRPAVRPSRTVLSQERTIELGLPPMRDWESALQDFLLESA